MDWCSGVWITVVVVCALGLAAPPTEACATAPPLGETAQIADEEAVIVWDPATRTEHFIRRAAFQGSARSFGFLVPTPTTPELGEVDAWVFHHLAWEIRPAVRHATSGCRPGCMLLEYSMMTKGADEAPGAAEIRVIQTAHVAGFDATTVEADDPAALTRWLGDHGFAATPALTAWLARYVAEHWKLTAFVVASDQQGAERYEVATRAVRMTFHTDRPFYPYREPAASEPAAPGRLLRVFLLSSARYAASLGGEPWSARVLHAAPIDDVGKDLAPLTGHRFATVFVDDSAPRRATDEVYFAPSPDTSQIRQPAVVIGEPLVVPLEAVVLLAAILWLALRRRRRHRRRG